MRKIARIIGFGWVAAMIFWGIWLGISGVFWNAPGLLFQSGMGDIWILALLAAPGYFLWKWGENQPVEKD